MQTSRRHPAPTWLLTLAVAAWLVASPLLVVCTCEEGHAVVASVKHEAPACGHDHHHDEPAPQGQDDHAPAHNDAQFSVDLVANTKTALALPAAIALPMIGWIDRAELDQPRRHLAVTPIDTGPPLATDSALRATILLI